MANGLIELSNALQAANEDLDSCLSAAQRSTGQNVSIDDYVIGGVIAPTVFDINDNPVTPTNLNCGITYTARLDFSGEGQYFSDLYFISSHWSWQGTGGVSISSTNGYECEFNTSGTGTIEGKLTDGFNVDATNYNTYVSTSVDCSGFL